MKAYKAYKDSGISWIGQLPQHWEVKKIRELIEIYSDKGHPNEPLLSVVRDQGVIIRDITSKEENHNFIPTDLSGYKRIKQGDFVINKMKAWQGSYAVSDYQGIVSPAYYTCKLRCSNKVFFNLAIRCKAYIPFFAQYSKGIRVGQWDLSPMDLKGIPFFLPPFAEQEAIVSYLEEKTAKIDRFVTKKEEQILRLKELREAIIAQAVTRGIQADVALRLSGVSWLGDIPKHWEKRRCKDLLTELKEQVGENSNEYTLLSLTTNGVIVRDLSEGKGKFPKDFDSYKIVKPDNLVFCLFDVDETPRTVGHVKQTGMLTGAYNVFDVRNVNIEYLYHYFISLDDRKALKPLYKGLRKVIPLPTFMAMPIFLPPLAEQEAIVAYITQKTEKIDQLIESYRQEIDRIKELKQGLISNAVLGHINVQAE